MLNISIAVTSTVLLFSDRVGSKRTTETIVPLNATSSGDYTPMMDQPVEVSGVELIGIDIECEAIVRWNISTQGGLAVCYIILQC